MYAKQQVCLRDIQKQLRRQCYCTSVRLGTQKQTKGKKERRVWKERAPSATHGGGEAKECANSTEQVRGPMEHHPKEKDQPHQHNGSRGITQLG